MDSKNYLYLGLGLLLILVLGCAGYGRVRYLPHDGESVTIEQLLERFNDYNVYYAGYAVDNPSGILFDPKADKKTLVPSDRWIKVEDRDTVSQVVGWIGMQRNFPGYIPSLYGIYGPDDQLYAYVYSVWFSHTVSKVIDEKTLFVYDLPAPPSYYGPDGGSGRGGGP